MNFKRSALATLTLAAVGLAACGGHTKHPAPKPQVAQACPAGHGTMGCSVKPALRLALKGAPPAGLEFPDVSSYQGAVNWPAVAAWQRARGWHPFAAFKMGEANFTDTQAARTAQQTRASGIYTVGYWFVRPMNCATEAAGLLWDAQRFAQRAVILDMEVPGLTGYAACLAGPLEAHGIKVAVYTSPGTWSGAAGDVGGRDVWIAAYGPSAPPCAPAPWACNVAVTGKPSITAWQFTDGRYGPAVSIPGLGNVDVSVSYGIDRLAAPPQPPAPPKPTPKPTPKPKPKPVLTVWQQGFNVGFQAGWKAR